MTHTVQATNVCIGNDALALYGWLASEAVCVENADGTSSATITVSNETKYYGCKGRRNATWSVIVGAYEVGTGHCKAGQKIAIVPIRGDL